MALFNHSTSDRQRILTIAACFEDRFSIDWLIQLADSRASVILDVMEKGVSEGLLEKLPHSFFQFVDQNARNDWRRSLAAERRETLHKEIADLMIKDLPDGEEKAKWISHYLLESVNDQERCVWLLKAGDIFLQSHKALKALECYDKVLEDLDRVTGIEADNHYIETAIRYSKIAFLKFDVDKTLEILIRALLRAEHIGNPSATARLQMHIAKNEWYRSNYEEALERFKQGWQISMSVDEPKLIRSVTTFSTFFHYWLGYFQEAVSIYEKEISDLEGSPRDQFPLMAQATVGNCYTTIGQIAQGLGIIDRVQQEAVEQGDRFMEAFVDIVKAVSLLGIHKDDEAVSLIRRTKALFKKQSRNPLSIVSHLLLAYYHFRKEENAKSLRHLKVFLDLRRQTQMSMWPYPYLLELCWAMETGQLPFIEGISLDEEINQSLKSQNANLSGLAYRFLALKQQKEGADHETMLDALISSETWLEMAGNLLELARTRLLLAYQFETTGEMIKARNKRATVSAQISRIPVSLVPSDLRPLIEKGLDAGEIVKDILAICRKSTDANREGLQLSDLISAANSLLGAERGAIFIVEDSGSIPDLRMKASRHLTGEQICEPPFESSLAAIRVSLEENRPILQNLDEDSKADSAHPILSLICAPVRVSGRAVGMIYLDNRMIAEAFNRDQLELLDFFTAMAARIMENEKVQAELSSITAGNMENAAVQKKGTSRNQMIGQSQGINEVLKSIEQVAETDSTVLIMGETGVGKELVAQAIHDASHRSQAPFIGVNCNALPDSLISSELFGHEKGAFTGALQKRVGRFELAQKGTLFIDEIGELPLETQVKLLRVIQTREFERIGGHTTIKSDFRLITATNRNLEDEIKKGHFRADLYFRLNIYPILVPPLRDRRDDILLLARHFLQISSMRMGKKFISFPEKEIEKLMAYSWPGNVRELENVIERGVIQSCGNIFNVPELVAAEGLSTETPALNLTLEQMERSHIEKALNAAGGRVRGLGGAAQQLDIHPSTLYSKMKKLGIQPNRSRKRSWVKS